MNELWNLFLETGAPEYYLLYKKSLRKEETGVVSQNQGPGAAGDGLQ